MSLLATILAPSDRPLALRPGDRGYAEATRTVREWVKLRQTSVPDRVLIYDWRPGRRLAMVEITHRGAGSPFRMRAFYHEVGGRPVHASYLPDRKAMLPIDQSFVSAAFETCSPLLAR